jgi:hypothetical protein
LAQEAGFSVGFKIEGGRFFWDSEPSRLTKEKMLAQPKDDETKAEQEEAVTFLREALSDGARPSKEIEKEAREASVTNYALKNARRILGVEAFKNGGTYGGDKRWFVRLPGVEAVERELEEGDSSEPQPLQANREDKTVYRNNLVEEVENRRNQPVQHVQTTSSRGGVPEVKMAAVCSCGTNGFVGEKCLNCQKIIIPF